ncbi:MAG: hypothetical protein DMF07_06590 [Verrucomicrobia bacterium]|nr:MAG: hypothetical protein DMF07_06590 [Verrucomicrobiota bacterium]
MKPYEQLIRIIYPQDGARIAIRTDNDWDTDVNAVGRNACISEFLIETERPYFYFKPVLISDDSVRWSRRENFLAVTTSNTPLKIHPYFREDAHCSVCELMPPLASPTGVAHRFRVFLPPGYHENTLNRNPVLYMHDGHNLFLKEEAFVGNTWRTDEVLNMLDKMNAIEETIVVGVFPHDRMNEYTKPGYEDYGRFLVEVLKPLVDKKYRTLEDPVNTAVMGSSLGGVVSFYLGLDSGWPADNYEPTRSMRDRLIWKGYRSGTELFYLAFPEAKHDENAWATRSPIPFQFLFGKLPSFR